MNALQKIRTIFFDNFVIKVFSLLFAVVLWFHVVSKGKSEVNFVVPLELTDIPREMAVVNDVPGYVDVRLMGPEGMLKSISPREIRAVISLADKKEGESLYYLGPTNITAPGYAEVTNINPAEIRLRLESVARKAVPVSPALIGRPAKGYRVDNVTVEPETVTVEGPKSVIARMEKVNTKAVDISGAMGSFDRLVMLETPAGGVRLEVEGVRVEVTLIRLKR